VRATMTCPGLMIPSHVGLCYMPLDWTLDWLAAWRSGNGVGRINEVTLRRARLVLGWVTCPGSTPGGGTLFQYVTSQPRPTQPFILSGSIN